MGGGGAVAWRKGGKVYKKIVRRFGLKASPMLTPPYTNLFFLYKYVVITLGKNRIKIAPYLSYF
jgi:hypothetical protein